MIQPCLRHIIRGCAAALALAGSLCSLSLAENLPAPSRHQMMKDCMAKQKASEAGRTKEDMRSSCKDVTKTEKQNADKAVVVESKEPKR